MIICAINPFDKDQEIIVLDTKNQRRERSFFSLEDLPKHLVEIAKRENEDRIFVYNGKIYFDYLQSKVDELNSGNDKINLLLTY